VDAAHESYASFAEKGREGKGNEPKVRQLKFEEATGLEFCVLVFENLDRM